jgi:hypothetical protein
MTEIKIPDGVLSPMAVLRLCREADRAHAKHGERSLLGVGNTNGDRLAALMEEVGEVAHALTYDTPDDEPELITELVQVANVAMTWAEFLMRAHYQRVMTGVRT